MSITTRRRPVVTASNARWFLLAGVLIFLAVVAFFIFAWLGDDDDADPVATVSPSQIIAAPDIYYGERVTVRGEVQEVLGRRIFTMGENGLLVLGTVPVAVGGAGPGEGLLDAGDSVQVTGTVQLFNIANYELADDVGVSEADIVRLAGDRPAIIAEAVTPLVAEDEKFGD